MRTIQVINVRWFNATAYYALNLAKLLNDAGHPSLVLCLADTECYRKAEEMGLPIVCLNLNTKNPFYQLLLPKRIASIIESFKPDLINCHRGEAFVYFAQLKNKYNYKLIRTRGDQRKPKNNLTNRYLYSEKADAIICTNSQMANYIIEDMEVPSEQVHIIYGGVDTQKFKYTIRGRDKIRSQYGYDDKDIVIGLFGRFDRVKGQKELIELFAKIYPKVGSKLKLMLVGFSSATKQEEVETWIKKAGIEDLVKITGKVENIQAYYSAIDIAVITSLYSECIARVALEIMSTDRPLISTDVGVMPDLLANEALFPVNDFDLLGEKIINCCQDCHYIDTLLINQKLAMRELDFAHFLSQTLSVYKQQS